MYSNSNKRFHAALALGACLIGLSFPAAAGTTDLADGPLANSTTTAILPNIMMDLDNSGSMNWDYMPDYVRYAVKVWEVDWRGRGAWRDRHSKFCKGNDNDSTALITCEPGDPPFYANEFNGVYYNPSVKYGWPVNADGTRKADPGTRTTYLRAYAAVASDGYGVQRIDNSSGSAGGAPCLSAIVGGACPTFGETATINLAGGYPERVWCKTEWSDVTGADCKSALANNVYSYPNTEYTVMKVKSGYPFYYNVSVEWCNTAENGFGKVGTCQAKRDDTFKYVRYFNWSRVDIKPTATLPAKALARTDCAGATCTYDEEMTNFATWYAWYRTRMQMTKSAIGLAFSEIRGTHKTGAALAADRADPTFLHARVGLTQINTRNDVYPIVNIANFDSAQKGSFYTSLYAAFPRDGTPLRTSLDLIGKMYQGDTTVFTDPVQYSCQKNFTILATDGYWNDTFSGIGDPDGATGVKEPSQDELKSADTLADVAYHYYHTDLRTGCTGTSKLCENNVPPSGTNNETDDVAQHQHMTTFTISLGLDGTLAYDNNYKTATSGDYHAIRQGVLNWPVPVAGTQTTIDDLWHTAVNGRGTYFSTRDPSALEDGLQRALNSIDRATGSGAAAATSNLQPTAGDNFIYIATYRTVKWDGEMSAYSIDLATGAISASPIWQAEALLKAKIGATGATDTRTIYTSDGTTRTLFKVGDGGLTADQVAYFDNRKLSQFGDWTAAQQTGTTAEMMVNALRGHDRNEDQDRNEDYGTYNRLYRDRDGVLGDIIHAQPVFVKAPPHSFADTGYSEFKIAQANRAATVYVASNDGMLHAFDGTSGEERWAYVPPIVMPEMYRLVDTNYENNHRFYLDGPVTISDAYIGRGAARGWKTILIGALGKGGRGYYALDVTNPADPKPLWDFTAEDNNNVGYSYGTPFITKLGNGDWVAVVTSGYNNVREGDKYTGGDGKGYVFVLDLETGAVKKTISTDVGDTATPSGLARLNLQVRDFDVDDTAIGAYGGDLYGNMWRFDLDAGTKSKLAAFGNTKPIMVAPEIADVGGNKAVFFGTGRYLGVEDLTNTSVQTIYGLKDDGTTTLTDTSRLIQQTITAGTGETRNISNNTVDWTTKHGWYVNLTDSGERVNIDPQLYFGTLLFATTVPSATACQPGGYSWMYQLNYATGGNVKPFVTGGTNNIPGGNKYTSPIVGLTVSKLPTGTPVIYTITADGKKPAPREMILPPATSATGTKRVLWRELFD